MLDGRAHKLLADRGTAVPIENMIRGKSRRDAAELLPRIFNLCRTAQGMAARLALGLPEPCDSAALRQEILRDHVLRLTMILPGHFGIAPMRLPSGWQHGGAELAQVLFGPTGTLPDRASDYDAFLASGVGVAAVFGQIGQMFKNGEAASQSLPFVTTRSGLDPAAQVENSCAARVSDHPIVAATERQHGRGPLWRVVARAYDLHAMLSDTPLLAHAPEPGVAHVPATRGLYSVKAKTDGDMVVAFKRVTPTDHLQARGGVLDQTLASLPADRSALAPLVMDILDPCTPIRVREVQHA